MAGLVHSIEELVGRTPLMELDRFERQQQCGAHLLAKLEFFNPTGSVKDPFPLVKDIVGYLKMCHSILPIKR